MCYLRQVRDAQNQSTVAFDNEAVRGVDAELNSAAELGSSPAIQQQVVRGDKKRDSPIELLRRFLFL